MTKLECIQKFKDMGLPLLNHSVKQWLIPGTDCKIYFVHSTSIRIDCGDPMTFRSTFYDSKDAFEEIQYIIQETIEEYEKGPNNPKIQRSRI